MAIVIVVPARLRMDPGGTMRHAPRWALRFAGGTMVLLLSCSFALAQGNGNGHGKKNHGDDHDQDVNGSAFSDHDRSALRDWYGQHRDSLPPGLAKKDQLPPGLEKQLVERGTLPPGLQKHVEPVPVDLERRLTPPPPDCAHVLIGGHVVVLNRKTNLVVAAFHFEIN